MLARNVYRDRLKGLYVVVRSLFLLLLNCSARPCLGPAWQDLQTSYGSSVERKSQPFRVPSYNPFCGRLLCWLLNDCSITLKSMQNISIDHPHSPHYALLRNTYPYIINIFGPSPGSDILCSEKKMNRIHS